MSYLNLIVEIHAPLIVNKFLYLFSKTNPVTGVVHQVYTSHRGRVVETFDHRLTSEICFRIRRQFGANLPSVHCQNRPPDLVTAFVLITAKITVFDTTTI